MEFSDQHPLNLRNKPYIKICFWENITRYYKEQSPTTQIVPGHKSPTFKMVDRQTPMAVQQLVETTSAHSPRSMVYMVTLYYLIHM